MSWFPWRKGSTDASPTGRSGHPSSKPKPTPPGEEFIKSLRVIARNRGFEAAEQMIYARDGRLWDKLSTLAEPTDPARAAAYAERYAVSLDRWMSWLKLRLGDPERHELTIAESDTDDVETFLNALPTAGDLAPKMSLSIPREERLLAAINKVFKEEGLEEGEQFIQTHQARAWNELSKVAERRNPTQTVEYARRAYACDSRPTFARRLQRTLFRNGDILESERLLRSTLDASDAATPNDLQQLAMIQGWKTLLLHGLPLPERRPAREIDSIPDKALYCLHNSLPQSSAGYAMRSHGLLRSLETAGISVVACTRYGYPWDLPENRRVNPRPEFPLEDVIENVRYRRSRTLIAGRGQIPVDSYIQACAEEVEAISREERPSVIHAASNFLVGLAAIAAGRRLGLPVVYEVRGLWEVTHASRDPSWTDTEFYRAYVRMETQAAVEADRVIAITDALKDELIRRGVPAERIDVVRNSVDADRFLPEPKDRELEQQLGLESKRVVGYVGSVTDYEGLDHLLYAIGALVDEGIDDLHLLIVGDGSGFPKLQSLVLELELEDRVTLTGRVPFDEVHRYYSLIDVAPFPRKPLPVTEMVSPLKPFEAMAMEKAVLVSSVAALVEIVEDGTTGLIFEKGNVDSLVPALRRLVTDPELCSRLGKNARAWVVRHRSWEHAGSAVAEIYRELAEDTVLKAGPDATVGREVYEPV